MTLGRTNINLPEIPVKPKELVLYDHGDQCTDVTGGWSRFAAGPYDGTGALQDDRIYVTQTRWYTAGFSTANKIDMTDYTSLKVLYSLSQSKSQNGSMDVYVDDAKETQTYTSSYPAYPKSTNADAEVNVNTACTEQIVELDITNITGEKYPLIAVGGSNEAGVTVSVYKVWLE